MNDGILVRLGWSDAIVFLAADSSVQVVLNRQLTHRSVRTQDFPDFWVLADYGQTEN
jgi:hypothetical protein